MSQHGHDHAKRQNSTGENASKDTKGEDEKELDKTESPAEQIGEEIVDSSEKTNEQDLADKNNRSQSSMETEENNENHDPLSPRSESNSDNKTVESVSDEHLNTEEEGHTSDMFEEELELEPCQPEDFNSRKFYEATQIFIEKFGDDHFKDFSSIERYPLPELKNLAVRVNVHMKDFHNYSLFMQNNVNKLRSKLRIMSGKIREYLPRRREPQSEDLTVEERELVAKIEALKGELAQANVDLAQAAKLAAESESSAYEAALSAQRAKDLAKRLKEEMEEQKRLEEEAKIREEERRIAKEEEKKRKDEERRQHELKQQKEAENRAQSRSQSRTAVVSNTNYPKEKWDDWPVTTYNTETNEYNQGVLCNVRADPKKFDEYDVICESVDQFDTNFTYSPQDELISCIIRVKNANSKTEWDGDEEEENEADHHDDEGEKQEADDTEKIEEETVKSENQDGDEHQEQDGGDKDTKADENANEEKQNIENEDQKKEQEKKLKEARSKSAREEEKLETPIFIAIPHCLSRLSAIHREPVIKAKVRGVWKELLTHEVSFESTKDLKFSQVELTNATTLAVVSRFKTDYLKFLKRGNKVNSSTDSRITLTAQPGTFDKTEHVILQVQPVESHSVHDIRLKEPLCKGLLASSSIINIEWETEELDTLRKPLKITLPCPPNPAKARKAAAIRAMKEARMKNPPAPGQNDDPNKRPEQRQGTPSQSNPNRWYMGAYGTGDDDENDNLFMFSWSPKTKWQLVPHVNIQQIRLDLLQLDLVDPLMRFVVLRTNTLVNDADAKTIITELEAYLEKRTVKFMLKQRHRNMSEVVIHCVPRTRVDRLMESLREEGFDEGPAPSMDISVYEGDVINLSFRGNVKSDDEPLSFVYNSHLRSSLSFNVSEIDKYLQKSFPMYRGFTQVFRACPEITGNNKKKPKQEFLCDLLVGIPKYHILTPSPPQKAPVTIKAKDVVNANLLRHFAEEIGDEGQRLATILGVNKVRLQAIWRNNYHSDLKEKEKEIESIYNMLMTWLKKVPRGDDKVSILRRALRKCERLDLMEQLDDLNKDFLAQKSK